MSTFTVNNRSRGLKTELASSRFAVVSAVVTALYVYCWATRWTLDPATTSPFLQNSFFTEQARSILRGHLWVDAKSHPWECFFVDNKCYGYFGIVPSLVRVPLVLLGGSRVEENAALFIALASGVATWAGVDLCRRVLLATGDLRSRWAPWSMLCGAMLLGPAGLLLLLIDPYVYQESLAWSVAGTLVAVNYVLRWWQSRAPRLLMVATVALVAASGARPTSAFVGVVVAVGLWFLTRKEGGVDTKNLIRLVALALVPVVTTFGVLMLKFGSPLPPYESYESRASVDFQYLETINPGLKNGIGNAPTSLFAYLRPDAVRFESSPPFVNIRFGNPRWGNGYDRIAYLPPIPQDYLYVERTTSLTVLAPLGLAAVFAALFFALRRPRQWLPLILLASVAVQPAVMLMTFGVSLRYLVDFYPLFACGIAFVMPRFEKVASLNPRARGVVVTGVGLLTVWSLWVIPALATQDARIYIFGIAPR